MLNLASWRNFKATVMSFPGFLLTFVNDTFDRNVTLLIEFHNFHLSFVKHKLDYGQYILTDFHRQRIELSTDM